MREISAIGTRLAELSYMAGLAVVHGHARAGLSGSGPYLSWHGRQSVHAHMLGFSIVNREIYTYFRCPQALIVCVWRLEPNTISETIHICSLA